MITNLVTTESTTEINPETKIWRYIDITKFIHMLATRSIYFPAPNQFDDPYEGLMPKSHIEAHIDLARKYVDASLIELSKFKETAQSSEEYAKLCARLDNVIKNVPALIKESSNSFGISCWHISEYESEAMWKIYSPHSHGIAIESTAGRLKNSLNISDGIIIDKVRYMDFDEDPIDKGHKHYGLFIKRKSFEHEKELRATIKLQVSGKGVSVPCDIDTLINAIHISPNAPNVFKEVVDSLISHNKYNLSKPVVRSKLFDKPDYLTKT